MCINFIVVVLCILAVACNRTVYRKITFNAKRFPFLKTFNMIPIRKIILQKKMENNDTIQHSTSMK